MPREVVAVLAATFVMVGAFDVIAVSLALGPLGLGGSGAGYLTAAHGAGALAGAAASIGIIGRGRLVPVVVAAAALAGVAFFALALATSVALAFLVVAVVGASRSLLEVTGQTLLQRVTSTELLARVFAFKEALGMGAWGLGSALVPLFVALGGLRAALVFAGAVLPVVVLLRLRPLLLVDAAATAATVAIALLRSLPLFRPLPIAALEGVAATATELSVPPGEVVVHEGEAGDCYYAIAGGEVQLTRRGEFLASLSRGEGFGEIALLHGGIRTATVSSLTDTQLLVVQREPFLVAVTGHGPTHARAAEIATERLPSAAPAGGLIDRSPARRASEAAQADTEEPSSMESRHESERNGSTTEEVTKEERLERARRAGIEGRSSMTKDELRAALRDSDADA